MKLFGGGGHVAWNLKSIIQIKMNNITEKENLLQIARTIREELSLKVITNDHFLIVNSFIGNFRIISEHDDWDVDYYAFLEKYSSSLAKHAFKKKNRNI